MGEAEPFAGFRMEGDIAPVRRALAEGRSPRVVNPFDWPIPRSLSRAGEGPEKLIITDQLVPIIENVAILRPPSLIIGIGVSSNTPPNAVGDLVIDTLAEAELSRSCVYAVATLDRHAGGPSVAALGFNVLQFSASVLATTRVPNPSRITYEATGTPSVCEAAALRAAGSGARLIVAKRHNRDATLAIARRRPPISLIRQSA